MKQNNYLHASQTKLFILVLASILCTSHMVEAAYDIPPSWRFMTMLDISFDTTNKLLSVVAPTVNEQLSINTLSGQSNPNWDGTVDKTATNFASFDPGKPWAVLKNKAFSRRFGWDTSQTTLAADIQAAYGADASIWIESIAQSPGLETYLAIGKYGVNGHTPYTTDVDETLNPRPYSGIFGTGGSSTKWKWDYQMDHNTYAVPLSYLVPNQQYSATYKVYPGDSHGNEILNNNGTSASTLETWTWQAPATWVLPAPSYGDNLVVNGDAEGSTSVPDTSTTTMLPPAGWATTGSLTAARYDGSGGFPTSSTPGPVNRGTNFFAGGRGSGGMGGVNISTAQQNISLLSFLGDIAEGRVGYSLSAFLGGYSNDDDNSSLNLSFLDASSNVLASVSLSAVLAIDRTNVTSLLYREAKGFVPAGSKWARLLLTMTKVKGMYNDASADNITFSLQAPGPELTVENKIIVSWPGIAGHYVAESAESPNSDSWNTVTNTPGTVNGQTVILVDPASTQRYYRLRLAH